MNDFEIYDLVKKFPIGEPAKNREELLSKAGIISYLAPYQDELSNYENQDELEEKVKEYLGRVLEVREDERIPEVYEAENILHLSKGFLQDYGKVEYIKENDPNFSRIYNIVSRNLELNYEKSGRGR